MLTKDFWAGRHFPLFEADTGAASGGTESESKSGEQSNQDDSKKGDGEKGDDKEALKRLGEQRDAARTETQTVKEERDALLKEKTDRAAAETKRKEKEAAEAGKFEELAATRERERDEALTEATSLKAENDQLKAAMTEGLAVRVKGIPESVRDTLNDTFSDDDVLGRWNWLHKPSVLKLITEKAETARGNGRDPRAGMTSDGKPDAAKLVNELRQLRGIRSA